MGMHACDSSGFRVEFLSGALQPWTFRVMMLVTCCCCSLNRRVETLGRATSVAKHVVEAFIPYLLEVETSQLHWKWPVYT
ncbi:hypothetical protein FKM82_014972 [Ascaphus truei]